MPIDRVGLALKRNGSDPADIYLDQYNDLALVRNSEAIGQHARQRLMTFSGEWFLDIFAGVPWLREILGKSYDPVLAEAVIKKEILDTDGVTEITTFSTRFERETRNLSAFDIEVITEYGEVKV